MNAIVLVCLLSVSQRSIHDPKCGCNGGVCRARPTVASRADSVKSQPQVSPLDYIASLKGQLADSGRDILAARKELQDAKDEVTNDYIQGKYNGQYDSMSECSEVYKEQADKLESLIDDRDKLLREIYRVQDFLVRQKRLASEHGQSFVRVDPGIVGAMQAYAVRRALRGL